MLQPEPESRPSARQVRRDFANAIARIPSLEGTDGLSVHCVSLAGSTAQQKSNSNNSGAKTENDPRKPDNTAHVNDTSTLSSPMSGFDFGFSDDLSGSNAYLDDDRGDASLSAERSDVLLSGNATGQGPWEDLSYNVAGMGKLSCGEEWINKRKSLGVGN